MKCACATVVLVISALAAAGCGPSRQENLQQLRTNNPRFQTAAIARVALAGDKTLVGELIRLLGSKDEGIRFTSVAALQRLTDKAIDMRTMSDPAKREVLVKEWRQWWETEGRAACKAPVDPEPVPEPAPSEEKSAGASKESHS